MIVRLNKLNLGLMMERQIISSIFFFMLLINFNCYYDVEEELYPNVECSTEGMSYSMDITPILNSACYACHDSQNNFGNVTIDSHEALLEYVNNGQLLGAIKHEPGFSPMPKNSSKLLECEIEKIEQWVSDGALNN